jgi:hypothetical protein
MDWFKRNPFTGALAAITGVLAAAAGYFLYGAHARFAAEQTRFEEQAYALQSLQAEKPFPNEENVRLVREELEQARAILGEIGKNFATETPTVTPQEFQDQLREMVNDIVSRAEAGGVTLGEDFYLGFEAYEAQPPAAAAAGPLALQLKSIHAVAGHLVDAKVREIAAINRQPLAAESPASEENEREDGKKPKPGQDALPDLVLAPFGVTFSADQAAFRTAFNRLLESDPPVFVRLLAVTNSAPSGPSKSGGVEAAAGEEAPAAEAGAPEENGDNGAIRPVLGEELAIVDLQLASVSTGL